MAMSVLSGKRIAICPSIPLYKELKVRFAEEEADVLDLHCRGDLLESDTLKDFDILVLDYVHDALCVEKLLRKLRDTDTTRELSVIVYIANKDVTEERVLLLGAADYITEQESAADAAAKIKALCGEPDSQSKETDLVLTEGETVAPGTTVRVFAVEDDPLLQNLLVMRFDQAGFSHEFSSDGKQVVSKVKHFKPHVILLDLMLPGIEGFDVLKDLKEETDTKHIPVVIFSNKDGQEDRKRAQELGADSFHVKALTDLSDLVKKLESFQ